MSEVLVDLKDIESPDSSHSNKQTKNKKTTAIMSCMNYHEMLNRT